MSIELKNLVKELKQHMAAYDALGVRASKIVGKWPFDSQAEVQLRQEANHISQEIMFLERKIITELLK